MLARAAAHPDAAPADVVVAVFDDARLGVLGDPAGYLAVEQPHPTDTHPPTRQRLAKLGFHRHPTCSPPRLRQRGRARPAG